MTGKQQYSAALVLMYLALVLVFTLLQLSVALTLVFVICAILASMLGFARDI